MALIALALLFAFASTVEAYADNPSETIGSITVDGKTTNWPTVKGKRLPSG